MQHLRFLLLGSIFGFILTKAEVLSWFRIQEMFHFDSFHMYGIIGSAIFTAMISLIMIKKYHLKTVEGEPIILKPKALHKGTLIGGIIFGLGWAFTGACPGPMFALVGNGYLVILVMLMAAVAGTWTYGFLRKHLPH
jgi:uncharacterized membrane protein YedE/YeeE